MSHRNEDTEKAKRGDGTCCTLMMYESVTPVCAGEILNRVPTVRIATTKVSRIPRKSRRIPSQRCMGGSIS